ncbi:MAG: DUF4855 domain-containing protein [Prevotellaceae bacterium]|jgi:hypothetical protein|nr:DUF4855 domain-containing protein [Prevotellaceae bacterium]
MDVKYTILIFILAGFVACSSGQPQLPDDNGGNGGEETVYPWEKDRQEVIAVRDMVLIYGGGAHRNVVWDKRHFVPYVSYRDKEGVEEDLFDGFLFLEYSNGDAGAPRIFATGYYGEPARKTDWKALADYYFKPGIALAGLEACVAEAEQRLQTGKKRKIVIVLPEPITAGANSNYPTLPANYWGEIDGSMLDFTRDSDRITACKWYVDYVRARFDEAGFQHLELTGFYWLAEESVHTKTILAGVAAHLNRWKYSFNWIPYWKETPDYYEWKTLKFTYAYLQPNYFFNEALPYSRLTQACSVVKQYDMDIELEFDERVLVGVGNRGNRLRDYMRAFDENHLTTSKRMAYYQGNDAIFLLSQSTAAEDVELFHEFCDFVK